MAKKTNYMENSVKRAILRQAFGGGASGGGNYDTGNTDAGISNNVVTNNPDVKQSMGSYLPNQTLLNAKRALIDQQMQGALQKEIAGKMADFQNKKGQVGLDIRKAMLMKKMGLNKPGAQQRSGYTDPSQVPTTGPGGLPLEEASTDAYGNIRPKYGRTKDAQAAYDTRTGARMKSEDNIKTQFAQQQRDTADPGILQKMGRFFYNPNAAKPAAATPPPTPAESTGGVQQAMMNRTSSNAQNGNDEEDDYDNMSEDELDQRARAGDQQAFTVGKNKFGKK